MTYITPYYEPVEQVIGMDWTDWVAIGLAVILVFLVVYAIRLKLRK